MRHPRPHLPRFGGEKTAACSVLGRARTCTVRTLPAALPALLFTRQSITEVNGGAAVGSR